MEPDPAELAQEQAYFDAAAKHRDRRLAVLADAPAAAAHPAAGAHLKRYASAAAEAAERAGSAVAFGRIDGESGESLYVGRQLIRDDRSEVLVVNWQAPAAAPYYEATPREAMRIEAPSGPSSATATRSATTRTWCSPHSPHRWTNSSCGNWRVAAPASCATSWPPSRPPSTTSSAPRWSRYSSSRAGRAPARRRWRCTASPGCCSTIATGSPPMMCSLSGPHPTFIRYIGASFCLASATPRWSCATSTSSRLRSARVGPSPHAVSRLKGEARMAGLLDRALAARIGVAGAGRAAAGGRPVRYAAGCGDRRGPRRMPGGRAAVRGGSPHAARALGRAGPRARR